MDLEYLRALARLPTEKFVVSASYDAYGNLREVQNLDLKLASAKQHNLEFRGVGLGFSTISLKRERLGIPPPSTQRNIVLRDLIDVLADDYRLDLHGIQTACQVESNETLAHPAYAGKYSRNTYISPKGMDVGISGKSNAVDILENVRAFIRAESCPLMFITGDSGIGKTCLVQHLYHSLVNSADSNVVPILIRCVGRNGEAPLKQRLEGILSSCVGKSDFDETKKLEAISRQLFKSKKALTVILDGVNEAKRDVTGVFDSVIHLLDYFAVIASANEGRFPNVKLIVTSRPKVFDNWYEGQINSIPPKQIIAKLLEKLKFEPPIHLKLTKFDVPSVLHGLNKFNSSTFEKELTITLCDPLVYGFFADLCRQGSENLAQLRTPWDVFERVFSSQLLAIQDQDGQVRDYVSICINEISKFCKECIASNEDTLLRNWGDNVYSTLCQSRQIFESHKSETNQQFRDTRFRYDRIGQYLIAQFAILERQFDISSRTWSLHTITAVQLVKNFRGFIEKAILGSNSKVLREVIRGGLTDLVALLLKIDSESAESGKVTGLFYDFIIGVLDQPLGENQNELELQSAVNEIVIKGLTTASPWYLTEITSLLTSWFDQHPKDSASNTGAVLRRVVFEILLLSPIDSTTQSSEITLKSYKAITDLAANGLVNDRTGYVPVLLQSMHASGHVSLSLEILNQSIRYITLAGSRHSWVRNLHPMLRIAIQHQAVITVADTLLLIFPEIKMEPSKSNGPISASSAFFLESVNLIYSRIPLGFIAAVAGAIALNSLRKNQMPLRIKFWNQIISDEESRNVFRKVVEAMEIETPIQSPVDELLSLVRTRRNAFIFQPACHALSARIADASSLVRGELINDLRKSVNLLNVRLSERTSIGKPDLLANDAMWRSDVGLESYVLSIVCYHLLVFYVEKLELNEKSSLYESMHLIAENILLRPPCDGMFMQENEFDLETSNIIGTLGKAAFINNKDKRFIELIEQITKASNDRSTEQKKCFFEFVFDSLGTLGTLLKTEPKLAIESIWSVYFGLMSNLNSNQNDWSLEVFFFESATRAFSKIRTIHPYKVEDFLRDKFEKPEDYSKWIDKLRGQTGAGLDLHMSWVCENSIARVMLDYKPAVKAISNDMRNNLHPDGIAVVVIKTMFRLKGALKQGDGRQRESQFKVWVSRWLAKFLSQLMRLN